MKEKILHLTLTRYWFDKIASGEKKIEYRDIKHYWAIRLFCFIEEMEDTTEWIEGMQKLGTYIPWRQGLAHRSFQELMNYFNVEPRHYDYIIFSNGYGPSVPKMKVQYKDLDIVGWDGMKKFGIELGNIIWIKNYKE